MGRTCDEYSGPTKRPNQGVAWCLVLAAPTSSRAWPEQGRPCYSSRSIYVIRRAVILRKRFRNPPNGVMDAASECRCMPVWRPLGPRKHAAAPPHSRLSQPEEAPLSGDQHESAYFNRARYAVAGNLAQHLPKDGSWQGFLLGSASHSKCLYGFLIRVGNFQILHKFLPATTRVPSNPKSLHGKTET